MMLRWMVPALVVPALAVMLTASAAVAADLPATPKRRAVVTQQEAPKVYVETDPDALISPAYGIGSYISNLPGTPLLPGSHTLPGYYGRPWDYDYQGSYYGGKQVDYFWRLPYSCGIYGYC